jgi:hypothetical protein
VDGEGPDGASQACEPVVSKPPPPPPARPPVIQELLRWMEGDLTERDVGVVMTGSDPIGGRAVRDRRRPLKPLSL